MAVNIFDKYGIKEVANVYFEALETDEKAGVYKGDIVLFLDTLKVSTIETTAENTAAQGGWGNPKLVQWDYGKEINITLEDALMSLESLRFMLGGAIKRPSVNEPVLVNHTAEVVCGTDGKVPAPKDYLTGLPYTYKSGAQTKEGIKASAEYPIRVINLSTGARTKLEAGEINGENKITFVNDSMLIHETDHALDTKSGDRLRLFWTSAVSQESGAGESAIEVTISPDTFPGTYKVVGDTYMRAQETGKDEPFQFVINKAKVQSNVTITLQAEGDPSTFEMTLNVLRDTNEAGENEMMKLVRYNLTSESASSSGGDIGSVSKVSTSSGSGTGGNP